MNDAFNEKHLRNTYQASQKGRTEIQERENLPHPTQTPLSLTLPGGLACLERQDEQRLGRAGFPLQESAGSFTGMP